MNPPFQTLEHLIEQSQNILILCSVTPNNEGSISAGLALVESLQKNNKDVRLVCSNPSEKTQLLDTQKILQTDIVSDGDFVITLKTTKAAVDHVRYVVKPDRVDLLITPQEGKFSPEDVQFQTGPGHTDLIITLGIISLTDLQEIFLEHTQFFADTTIINIDVSSENTYYGAVNWVDPKAASVCELLAQYLYNTKSINTTIATVLLAGIMMDTSHFVEQGTTPATLRIAAELYRAGAAHTWLIDALEKSKPRAMIELWGRVFGLFQWSDVYRIGWATVTQGDFMATGSTPQYMTGLMDNTLRHLRGADVIILTYYTDEGAIAEIYPSSTKHASSIPIDIFRDDAWVLTKTKHGVLLRSELAVYALNEKLLNIWTQYAQEHYNIPQYTPLKSVDLTQTHALLTDTGSIPTHNYSTEIAQPPTDIPFIAPEKTL